MLIGAPLSQTFCLRQVHMKNTLCISNSFSASHYTVYDLTPFLARPLAADVDLQPSVENRPFVFKGKKQCTTCSKSEVTCVVLRIILLVPVHYSDCCQLYKTPIGETQRPQLDPVLEERQLHS